MDLVDPFAVFSQTHSLAVFVLKTRFPLASPLDPNTSPLQRKQEDKQKGFLDQLLHHLHSLSQLETCFPIQDSRFWTNKVAAYEARICNIQLFVIPGGEASSLIQASCVSRAIDCINQIQTHVAELSLRKSAAISIPTDSWSFVSLELESLVLSADGEYEGIGNSSPSEQKSSLLFAILSSPQVNSKSQIPPADRLFTLFEKYAPTRPAGGAAVAKEFDRICSEIEDNLFLGSNTVAKNAELLLQHGITHIVNCAGTVCRNHHPEKFQYLTLFLMDGKGEDIECVFLTVLNFMDKATRAGGKILVHCQLGVSRSATILLMFLMWKHKAPLDSVLDIAKSKRSTCSPNASFIVQLLNWSATHLAIKGPIRMENYYRIVPQSPFDPKFMVCREMRPTLTSSASSTPSKIRLDSRGAFLFHTPLSLVVWIGSNCHERITGAIDHNIRLIQEYYRPVGRIQRYVEGKEPEELWRSVPQIDLPENRSSEPKYCSLYDKEYELLLKTEAEEPMYHLIQEDHSE